MVGLIWLVQVVHYPLFRLVGSGDFKGYHHNHTRLISWVVGPPMLAEGLSAAFLVWNLPPRVPSLAALAGFLLLLVIWASTAFLQVHSINSSRLALTRLLIENLWPQTGYELRLGVFGAY